MKKEPDINARLEAVFNEISDAILLADDQGRYVDFNQAAMDLLGYSRDELLTMSVFDLVVPSISKAEDLWSKFTAVGSQVGEIILRRKNRSVVICSYRSRANIRPGIHLSILRDISKQKYLIEKLEDTESRFRVAFENSALGMAIIGADGFYRDVNETLTNILGYNKEELMSLTFTQLTHPDDHAEDAVLVRRLINGEIDKGHRRKRYIHKSGATILASLRIATIRDRQNALSYFIVQVEDITEKDRLEKMILTERERFSRMFAEAPVTMAMLKGPTHIFEKVNDLCLRVSGKRNILGKTVREVFPELAAHKILDQMDEVYSTGKTYTANEMLVRLDTKGDGTLADIYLNIMYQPHRSRDGEVEGIFCFGVDVTEQVMARKRLESSEARYRQIVEVAHEGIWLFDETDATVFVNRKVTEIIEFDVADMIGYKLERFVHPDMKDVASSMMAHHRQVINNSIQLRFVSGTGKEIWANLNTNSIVDDHGSYKGCLAMVTDVTDKKRVADELLRLSLIARNTVNAVYITNSRGEIDWVNESFTRITGYDTHEVLNKMHDSFLYGELSDPATRAFIRRCIKNKTPFECEVVKYAKNGNPFWAQVHGQPIFNEADGLSHYFFIETDITEMKMAFQKLKETEKEIRSFASQLNTSLESERRRIAREIHDELGQQLTALKMLLTSLSAQGPSNEKSEKIITDMKQSIDAARSSIRVLATELRPAILDSLGLVPSLDWLSKEFEKKSGIRSTFNARVRVEPFQEKVAMTFFRICQEALTNIIKHSAATDVTIEIAEKGKYLSLKVADNGKGIPDEKLRNPFSMGLIGMRERANLINASFRIERGALAGTTVYLKCKIDER